MLSRLLLIYIFQVFISVLSNLNIIFEKELRIIIESYFTHCCESSKIVSSLPRRFSWWKLAMLQLQVITPCNGEGF